MCKVLYRTARGYVAGTRPWVIALLALAVMAAGCAAPSYGAYGSYGSAPAQPAPTQATATGSAPQVLPATGATPSAEAPAGGPAAGQSVKVSLKNFAFAPKVLTVAPGTTVEWQNDDSTAHTVTADNGSFNSGNMNQGATFKFTFARAGTYAYYCRYHGGPGGQGMAGQVVVK
jgi:plastocyanin